MSRREFDVPEDDLDFLENRLGLDWEAVLVEKPEKVRRIVVQRHPVPDGYNVTEVDLNLRIEAGYPDAQIDMVYFFPALSLKSGRQIRQLADDAFDGKTWQRWSRHRTDQNPWVSGLDNIERHLLLVREWLERELKQ